MLKTWYKLTSEETMRIYCVPAEIATHPGNHFWGLTYHPQEFLEGGWPLVILSSSEECPSAVTLQIHTLEMEILHEPGLNNEVENFNPLTAIQEGGNLFLSVEQIIELCNILRTQKHLFVDDRSTATNQPVFRRLRNDEMQFYRLHPEWFLSIQQSYHIQEVYPAISAAQNVISLVNIDSEKSISVMTFAQDSLLDESFTPLRRSGPQLYLSWSGLLEFVDILSKAVKQAS